MPNKKYTCASGETIYGGLTAAPTWAADLQEGTFKNISLNTLASQKPPLWGNITNTNGPFNNWSSAVYASDYGKFGAYVAIGSGHLTGGNNIVAGAWVFDLDTQLWSMKSGPESPIRDGITVLNVWGESTEAGSLGHPTVPHTYDGLVYMPESLGGAAGGSVLRNFYAGAGGSTNNKCVHKYDLIDAHTPPTRVIDEISTPNTYPATALDVARGGYWVSTGLLTGNIKFVSLPSYTVTEFPVTDGNTYGNYTIVYSPSRDMLIAVGDNADYWMGPLTLKIFISRITNGIPERWKAVNKTGWPAEWKSKNAGACWSEILDELVIYTGEGSNSVYRVKVPADPINTTWDIQTEQLTGVNGATPDTACFNGVWCRFIECVPARAFIYCGDVNGPVQAWRLRGM